jgi:hypothetical protein
MVEEGAPVNSVLTLRYAFTIALGKTSQVSFNPSVANKRHCGDAVAYL